MATDAVPLSLRLGGRNDAFEAGDILQAPQPGPELSGELGWTERIRMPSILDTSGDYSLRPEKAMDRSRVSSYFNKSRRRR